MTNRWQAMHISHKNEFNLRQPMKYWIIIILYQLNQYSGHAQQYVSVLNSMWLCSMCALVLCAFVGKCPCFMEEQHGEFSFPVDRHTCTTHTHAWVKLLTVLNRAASLSLKPLKCGSSSSSPSAVQVKRTPPLPPTPLLFFSLSPVPPDSLFCSHTNSMH